jgi:hypothetical protein
MRTLIAAAAALALFGASGVAQAGPKSLTEAQAHAAIDPWYSQFTVANRADPKAIQEKVVSPDYQTCNGYLPSDCWGRDASIRTIGGLAVAIPDLKFEIKEVLISGNRVTVVGEVSGTPAGPLFGVPYGGKSFRMMTVDIQTIEKGRMVRTIHMENWLNALNQLRAK